MIVLELTLSKARKIGELLRDNRNIYKNIEQTSSSTYVFKPNDDDGIKQLAEEIRDLFCMAGIDDDDYMFLEY